MQKEVKKSPCHPEAIAEGSYQILHYVQNDVVFQQGRTTPTLSFPCLTRESTGRGFNAPRYAQSVQSGRTLVETLGMLAIMGVLSVVGLAGYNSAMDKSKANNLIQEAQKRAVIVAGQIGFNNQTPSLAEFEPYNITSSGTFGDVITTGLTGQFGIKVSGVKKAICENILQTIGDTTPIRRLSLEATPTTPLTTCNDTNDFLIIYNNDMQGAASDTEYAIDDSSCKSVCGTFNPETHLCDESDCEIPENTCTTNDQCNANNECMVCDTETSQCKNGCERVEFLESTGTQYIDTGIVPNNNTSVEYTFNAVSTARSRFIVGCFGTTSTQGKMYLWVANVTSNWQYGFGTGASTSEVNYKNSSVVADTEKHTVIMDKTSLRMDGVVIVSGLVGDMSGNISSFWIGKNNDTLNRDTLPTKSYSCKMYDSNTLVRDFIPVLSPKGNCMFNRVPEDGKLKLYCNSGSGTFKTNKDN